MFHQLAQDQIDKFEADGIKLSPADVIRINDAAASLAAAKSDGRSELFDAPRCRWCGGFLLHEPTVQSELWMLEVAGALASNEESWGWMLAFSLVHADENGYFEGEEMRSAKFVLRVCRDFQRRLAATREELRAAVDWCRFGRVTPTSLKPVSSDNAERMEEVYRARLYADLSEAVALTGCWAGELRRMTCSTLDRVIRTAWERNGRTFKDAAVGEKTREWYRILSDISNHKNGRDGSDVVGASVAR